MEPKRTWSQREHLNDLPVKFSVCVNEGQDKLPTMYWLPKLHKRPYKARLIANSSSCTTTELSKLLTSCLTAIKSHVIRYCETVYETSNKKWFWTIKNSGEVLFSLPLTKVGMHFGHVRMCAPPYPISLIIFILDLGPSYTDKLLEFRWVQIAHLS